MPRGPLISVGEHPPGLGWEPGDVVSHDPRLFSLGLRVLGHVFHLAADSS